MLKTMRGLSTVLALVAAMFVGGGVVVARESDTLSSAQLLQRGIALSREAAYAASIAALEQARARGDLDSAQSRECSFYLATDYVAIGSTVAARRELRVLAERDREFELPAFTSPKVAALWHDVREEVERAPKLRALPPRRRA